MRHIWLLQIKKSYPYGKITVNVEVLLTKIDKQKRRQSENMFLNSLKGQT